MSDVSGPTVSTVEQLEFRSLLAQLRKSVELWFLSDGTQNTKYYSDGSTYDASLEEISTMCVEILMNGLQVKPTREHVSSTTDKRPTFRADAATDSNALQKLIADFEWVRGSVQLCDSLTSASNATASVLSTLSLSPKSPTPSKSQSLEHFLHWWVMRNLKSNCLCACLQTFVTDKELTDCYYRKGAFIRSDKYATAFFMCLSALELDQSSLLSQIDAELYSTTVAAAVNSHGSKHKRSSSHPNISISVPRRPSTFRQVSEEASLVDGKAESPTVTTPERHPAQPIFTTFRKIKSLPVMQSISEESQLNTSPQNRARSKTLCARSATLPRKIPQAHPLPAKRAVFNFNAASCSNTSSSFSGDDMQPSTSAGSRRSQLSNYSKCSDSTMSSASASVSPTNSAITSRRIELIKCDDIKIWTDQSCELKQKQPSTPKQTTESCAIPQNSLGARQAKSVSPINSFLASLFSTPPTYTSWSLNQSGSSGYHQTEKADDATTDAYPCKAEPLDACNNSGVFDSFLPVYGQKLRSRKSHNLFEDGISTLDYTSSPAVEHSANSGDAVTAEERGQVTPKNYQSLTSFLQMAQLSRNNTELEKENAHFRISEAIISAIEHIKWANSRQQETATATDWLEAEVDKNSLKTDAESVANDPNEHIPYAELGESCLDLNTLSAEVVGLSLISKFNDKQLPKVSELKWLVSEEDTPQKLLPLPNNNSSANPDENVMPSMTRGTKYWAPPRQQIIFTDHPQPNRKQLIQKQNNRCAGCGMRVSPQYIHSFRYCTYLGKYHCTGCHRNQISATPAKILHMWDFKCYPVSVFAYRLLEQMYTYPLFYVPHLNPVLYVQSKLLLAARTKRLQLKFVKDFIRMCRFADREQNYFHAVPDYITDDPDTWSMSDFVDVRNKSFHRSIDELIERCENHIFYCVLCTARGFICEYCHKEQVIYPWENKVVRCDRCGSCFHRNCWKSMLELCCRCQRMSRRQDEFTDI